MDIEMKWAKCFSDIADSFIESRQNNYTKLSDKERIFGSLYWLDIEMHNGGFIQFFCNFGYEAYKIAIEGLSFIKADETKKLLENAYSVISKLENDERIKELIDIPKYLSKEDNKKLNEIDEEYWEDKENIMEKMLSCFK